jgi:hypothetical protein
MVVPRWSHVFLTEKIFAIYCEDFVASGGYHVGATFFLTEKILEFTVRFSWHRQESPSTCHGFLTEKILLTFVMILWHRVGTTMEPRFSHRENFADFCDDFVAQAGAW